MVVELLEKPAVSGPGKLGVYCQACGHLEEDHPADFWRELEPCSVSGCDCPGWKE